MGLKSSNEYGDTIKELEPVYCFDKALEKNPKSMRAYDGKTVALINAGMIGEAQDVIIEAFKIDRYYPSIWYMRAAISEMQGDYDDKKILL